MRKSDKKLENKLRLALTEVCEVALKKVDGFQWLTHTVNFSDFPNSLKVISIFDTNANLEKFIESQEQQELSSLIVGELQAIDVKIKNSSRHILYDTEENCEAQHNGNWAKRVG